jgi:hypothetical protein
METLHLGCRTCEFQLNGICTNHKSEIGYGRRIDRAIEEKTCWSISLDYFATLVSTLPLKDQRMIRQDDRITVYELLERVETGEWNSMVIRRMEDHEEDKQGLACWSNHGAFV